MLYFLYSYTTQDITEHFIYKKRMLLKKKKTDENKDKNKNFVIYLFLAYLTQHVIISS